MRKPWVYKRKGIKGWWTGWYEGGRRKARAFPTKALAEHFRHIKYPQLNSDVFTSVVDLDWRHLVEEYNQFKQMEGRRDASICEVLLTLCHFERLVACGSSREITQMNLDAFVLKRSEEVGRSTLNAVTTGLRRGDVEAVRVGDIHFDRNTISTRNRKAGKAMPERPVPEAIMTELANHVAGLADGQEELFSGRFNPKKWDRVCLSSADGTALERPRSASRCSQERADVGTGVGGSRGLGVWARLRGGRRRH